MAKKEFTGVNVTTPTCRLAYPALFEMKPDLNGKEQYSVTMLFEKGTDMSELKAALLQAAKKEFGADVDLKTLDLKRIQDGDSPNSEGGERRAECKGQWVVKAKTAINQPGVVDSKLNKILDPSEIYSGVYAKVNLTAKAYTKPKTGVTFYLNHVQKVKDGETFAGGPKSEDVFEALDLGDTEEVAAETNEMDGLFG